MKDVYTLSDPLLAHLMTHRLEQEGIKSWINGEQLLCFSGTLPLLQGLVRISVLDDDAARARAIVLQMEEEGGKAPPPQESMSGRLLRISVSTVLFGLTGTYLPSTSTRKGRAFLVIFLFMIMFIVLVLSVTVDFFGVMTENAPRAIAGNK